MAQHTPGPWVVMAGRHIVANPERDGRMVASVDRNDFLPETREANAHLIAAAPDLLATLRALLDLHIAHHNNPAHAAARALIARAKGAA